jgi:6-phosphogluconolactonase
MDNNRPEIIMLKNPAAVAEYAANRFVYLSEEAAQEENIKHIALSGGSTPTLLFEILTSNTYKQRIIWQNIHLWWGDERAVPPDHSKSNFGLTQKLLLEKINIPPNNIHRIQAELDTDTAAEQYQQEIIDNITLIDNVPTFDWTILGMGEDGHTASLFKVDDNFYTHNLTSVTAHPQSGQKRISLSKKTLCASKHITFMVTGKNKAKKIKEILGEEKTENNYPASLISSNNGKTVWLLDEKAGQLL